MQVAALIPKSVASRYVLARISYVPGGRESCHIKSTNVSVTRRLLFRLEPAHDEDLFGVQLAYDWANSRREVRVRLINELPWLVWPRIVKNLYRCKRGQPIHFVATKDVD